MKRYPWLLFPLGFCLLTLLVTYPLVFHISTYVADTGDPLLNTWAIAWGQYAFLQPWRSVSELFDANAFYPYPHSLAFSEHLLLYAAMMLPLKALGGGPIFIHNVAILFSLVLAGWGMALLVSRWTGSRWAGMVAGIIFAFFPARLNHWGHLHQLSLQWLPFIILYFERWLTRRRWQELILTGLFLNLQLLSAINYVPQTLILVVLFLLFIGVPIIICNDDWLCISFVRGKTLPRFWRLLVEGGGLLLVTLLLNWPFFEVYFNLSELHNFKRTLGDASIYGAALIDYALPPPENNLYGTWLTPQLYNPSRPLIPLFIGLTPLLLAVFGLAELFICTERKKKFRLYFLLLLILISGILSFGANNQALGENLAPVTSHLLLYRWLFEYIPGFSGLRVPARMAILVFFGVAVLAGFGVNLLSRQRIFSHGIPILVSLLILGEYLSLPLPGTHISPDIPSIYRYLATDTAEKVVLELPYNLSGQGPNELARLYYSSFGWYRLVNGASGFNPVGLEDLSAQMVRFPDPVSLDILRQLGVTHLVLHADEFSTNQWQEIWTSLPIFWPMIQSISQFEHDYLLVFRQPDCSASSANLLVQPVRQDGHLALLFTNLDTTTLVVHPQIVNQVQIGNRRRQFIAPLFIPAGQSRMVEKLFPLAPDFAGTIGLKLPALSLDTTTRLNEPIHLPSLVDTEQDWTSQSFPGFDFGDDLHLVRYTLYGTDGAPCRKIRLRLYWNNLSGNIRLDTRVTVRLVDRFGRTIVSDTTYPWRYSSQTLAGKGLVEDNHQLPIVESIPTGQYGLLLELFSDDGVEIAPTNTGKRMVVNNAVLLGSTMVRPAEEEAKLLSHSPIAKFANGIALLDYKIDKRKLYPDDFLHLTLYWQANRAISEEFTVFTQLLTPEGVLVGQHDNPPRGGTYPTSLWRAGEIVRDDYFLQLDSTVPANSIQVVVGMYNSATIARVPLSGSDIDYLPLTSLTVLRPE